MKLDMLSFVLLLSILYSAPINSYTETSQDRCQLKSCLCEVKEAFPSYRESKTLTITFEENSSKLTSVSTASIDRFLNRVSRPVYVSGYADQCGKESGNLALSKERADSVSKYVRKKGVGIYTANFYGEIYSNSHGSHGRKVVLSTFADRISRKIDTVKADVYLIDASYSILDRWPEISRYDFPSDSRIYLSKTSDCNHKQRISSVIPDGTTEIWYSYYRTVQRMTSGETLLIVSDFNSTVPLTATEYKKIDSLVKKKNITVKTVRY